MKRKQMESTIDSENKCESHALQENLNQEIPHDVSHDLSWIYRHLTSPRFKSLSKWNEFVTELANSFESVNAYHLQKLEKSTNREDDPTKENGEHLSQATDDEEMHSRLKFLLHANWFQNLKYCMGNEIAKFISTLQDALESKKNIALHFPNIDPCARVHIMKNEEFIKDFRMTMMQVVEDKARYERNLENLIKNINKYERERLLVHKKSLKPHSNDEEKAMNDKEFVNETKKKSSDAQDQIDEHFTEEWNTLIYQFNLTNQWLKATDDQKLIQNLLQDIEQQTNVTTSIETFLKEYHRELREVTPEELDWSDRVMQNISNEDDRKMMILLRRLDRPFQDKLPWFQWRKYRQKDTPIREGKALKNNFPTSAGSLDNSLDPETDLITKKMLEYDLRHLKYIRQEYILHDEVIHKLELSFQHLTQIIYMNQIEDHFLQTIHPINSITYLIDEILLYIEREDPNSASIFLNSFIYNVFPLLLQCFSNLSHQIQVRSRIENELRQAQSILRDTISLSEKAKQVKHKYHDNTWLLYAQRNAKKDLSEQFGKIFANSRTCVRQLIKDCVEQSLRLTNEDVRFEVFLPMYLLYFHSLPFQEYDEDIFIHMIGLIHNNAAKQLLKRKSTFLEKLKNQVEIHNHILNANLSDAIWKMRSEDFNCDVLQAIASDRLKIEMQYLANATSRTRMLVKKRERRKEIASPFGRSSNNHFESHQSDRQEPLLQGRIAHEIRPDLNVDKFNSQECKWDGISFIQVQGEKSERSTMVMKERSKLLGLIEVTLKNGLSEDVLLRKVNMQNIEEGFTESMLKRLAFDYQLLNFREYVVRNEFHLLPRFVLSALSIIPHYEKMKKHQQTHIFNKTFYQIQFPDWSQEKIYKYTKFIVWMVKKLQKSRQNRDVQTTQLQREKIISAALFSTQHSKMKLQTRKYYLTNLLLRFVSCQNFDRKHIKGILLAHRNIVSRNDFQEIWQALCREA